MAGGWIRPANERWTWKGLSVIAAPLPVAVDAVEEREELFRNLVQTHGTRLHRFIVKNIGNRDDAQDMTQQAFLEAVRSYETYKGQ